MKPLCRALSLALLTTLAWTPVRGSEEFIHPWSSVAIKVDGTPETGNIRVESEVSGEVYTAFRIHAFGREESLSKGDLEKLRGFPLCGISVTSEPGYENIGGYTVHARLKRTRDDGSRKLKTAVMIVSLPKKGTIKVTQVPDGTPE